MNDLPDLEPVKIEYVENKCMQPFTTTCPKCGVDIYCDVPQITINCPKCNLALVRKGFNVEKLFTKGNGV